LLAAWLNVWQEPQCETNSCLPVTRFAVGCLSWQPPSATSSSAPEPSAVRPRGIRARALTICGRHSIQAQGVAAPPQAAAPSPGSLVAWLRMRTRQKYRMRTPSTGREAIIEAEPDRLYLDRETGEQLEVVAQLLPLAPTVSELPWAVENLRYCNWCDQLTQKDVNDCPHCGRRMDPLGS